MAIHKSAELASRLKITRQESGIDGEILRDDSQDDNFAVGRIGNLARWGSSTVSKI